MEHSLLSTLPLVLVFASLAYAAVAGEKAYSATGAVSILGIAATLLGLIVGWLLQRFLPANTALDDWMYDRSIRLGVGILFLCVSAITCLGVALIRQDALALSRSASSPRKFALLYPLFLVAVTAAFRGKIAAFLVGWLMRTGS